MPGLPECFKFFKAAKILFYSKSMETSLIHFDKKGQSVSTDSESITYRTISTVRYIILTGSGRGEMLPVNPFR